MAIHVVLDIVPQRIDRAAWADAFEETLALLEAHPARLLGYGFRVAAGVRMPVFTRGVEQGNGDPAERRWCVAGDRATLGTGERQRMYRDLGRYLLRCPPSSRPRLDDILVAAAQSTEAAPGVVRVFGEGEPSEPCGLPLLAAAMVAEARFPRDALVSGRFDREHAERARRWANGVLARPVPLPVRVDAFRLVERLGAAFPGSALVPTVDRMLLGEPGAREALLLRVFGRAAIEPWLAERLREHRAPDEPGARRLVRVYLDAARDLGRLATLACLDARGPRWDRRAFASTIADLPDPRGGPGPRIDRATLLHALGPVLGDAALAEVARRRSTPRPFAGPVAELECPPAIDVLASAASAAELPDADRERVRAIATAVREGQQALDDAGGPISIAAARRTVAGLLAMGGPTLTEDAWAWIERESDPELCRFLAGLAALVPGDAEQAAVRRALFENRALCRFAEHVFGAPAE